MSIATILQLIAESLLDLCEKCESAYGKYFLEKLIVSFASNFQDTLEILKSMGFCKQLLISTKKANSSCG